MLGAALQSPLPTIIVSIDNQDEAVRSLVRECSREFKVDLLVVSRPWPNEVRVGQVRNNGVKALLSTIDAPDKAGKDLVYFLDGDSVAPPGLIAHAEQLARGADLLVGGRICLTQSQTDAFSEPDLRVGKPPVVLGDDQLRERASRHNRYLWQTRLKPFGFVKPHKPKVLGASHGVSLGMYRQVNGYDESFLGAWREDDDFGRRVYLAGGTCRVAVEDLCVYHLWHALNPMKRENWTELAERKQKSADASCVQGLDAPRPQADLLVEHVAKGRTARETIIPQSTAPDAAAGLSSRAAPVASAGL